MIKRNSELINRLKNGDFSTLDLNDWFYKNEYDYIYAAIEGCDRVVNENSKSVLEFIATYAEMLLLQPNALAYDTIDKVKKVIGEFVDDEQIDKLSYEELIEYLNKEISKKCEDILTKIVIVGCNHFSGGYGDIVGPLCYSSNDTIRLYCCANLPLGAHDFSFDSSLRIRNVERIRREFWSIHMMGGAPENDLMKKRIKYFADAIRYGVIGCYDLDVVLDECDRISVGFYSDLFNNCVEIDSFNKDVFYSMCDKTILGYCLNRLFEDGELRFKEGVRLPQCFDAFYTKDFGNARVRVRTVKTNDILDKIYKN